MQPNEDYILMQRIAKADQEALAILMNYYLAGVIRFAEKILGSVAAAEDVAQEVFLKIWKVAGTWTPQASLKTWIYKIVLNRCLDIKRQLKHKFAQLEQTHLENLAAPQIADVDEFEELQIAIQKLSLREKSAIVLHYYEGYSQKEAAEILNVSLRTLERTLASAIKKLGTNLKDNDLLATINQPLRG
ncbi:MAG: RNA polymerase sigma factor [Deltaproteobacteria bacterium]|jgi:RNA polymerase sigma-70 factor (ECF subfamily)|nr:RNA polymerase sigma factor [Deltaproteobacteria bacterium]